MFNAYYTQKATLWAHEGVDQFQAPIYGDPFLVTCRVQYGNTLKQETDGSIYITAFTMWSADDLFEAAGWNAEGGGYLQGGAMPYLALGWHDMPVGDGTDGTFDNVDLERALTLEGITDFSGFVRLWRLSA